MGGGYNEGLLVWELGEKKLLQRLARQWLRTQRFLVIPK